MNEALNNLAGSFFQWLWAWLECLSYWIAAIGGTGSYILYIATHNKKFSKTCIALVVVYAMLAAAGSVV